MRKKNTQALSRKIFYFKGNGFMSKNYLSRINSPDDLKGVSLSDLPEVCQEIRNLIIDVVSNRGGHLASSLGAVEIATAIHYVYNTPEDKIVWDVGHQAYAHKILTGRAQRFSTLRSYKGISGFPNQNESDYDSYIVGHANTAISVALGMATAMEYQKIENKAVAVIGDATLTGGMAYEALNNAGHRKKNFLVILNDNEMSISKSVGGMSAHLNRLITAPMYNKLKKDMEQWVGKIPTIGHSVVKTSHKVEESIKGLIVPGLIFEEMGFRYFGPVDGHDVVSLIKILNSIKDNPEPMILHVVTKKGKGYKPAEDFPEAFHGAAPFDISTGESKTKSKPVSYTNIFGDVLAEMASVDDKIVAITAAMCSGTGLKKFAANYPDRFFDVGIAEQHAVAFAGGLAKEGLKPVVAIYSSFMQRAYDQFIHDVCLQNVPVCFVLDRGGLVGEDGPTHHGVFDLSYLRAIPNIVIAQPKDGMELKAMMKSGVEHDAPFAIRIPRNKIPVPFKDEFVEPIAIGKGELLRKGSYAVIITLGNHVYIADEICEDLSAQGIEIGLVNARYIKPIDEELIKSILISPKPIITIEDNAIEGGFGSAVLETVNKLGLTDIPMLRLGIKDKFVPHGELDKLYHLCGLDKEGIQNSITKFLNKISTKSFLSISD